MARYKDLRDSFIVDYYVESILRCGSSGASQTCKDQVEKYIRNQFPAASQAQIDRARQEAFDAMRAGTGYRRAKRDDYTYKHYDDGLDNARNVRYTYTVTVSVRTTIEGRVSSTEKRTLHFQSGRELNKDELDTAAKYHGEELVRRNLEESPDGRKVEFALSAIVEAARRDRIVTPRGQ